jgi:site-specific recombinase XerD
VDPVTAEALALAEQTRALRAGRLDGWGVTPHTIPGAYGELDLQQPMDAAWALLDDIIGDRAEDIAREEGTERGQDFSSIARDKAVLLEQHMDRWLAEPGLRGRVRKARTQMEFRGIVQTFGAWLAEQGTAPLVQRVSRAVAGQYVSHLHTEDLSSQRIRDIASALSGYWQWMGRKGVVAEDSNPWPRQAVSRPADGNGEDIEAARPFAAAEIQTLLTGSKDQTLLDLMHIAALTGMRIEEICQLTAGRCADGFFAVAVGKTAAAKRKVPIHPDLSSLVQRRTKGKDADAWLLHELGEPDRYGRRSPTIMSRFNRYRVDVGVHERAAGQRRSAVTFHSWRRWFITEALRAGHDLRVVKQVVGHKLPKADVTLGTYFGGDTVDVWRACVEAVRLPKVDVETEEIAETTI